MVTKLLTVDEVAEILGIKRARVYELSREGRLPFLIKLGDRQYRYHAESMHRWILNGGNAEPADLTSDGRGK